MKISSDDVFHYVTPEDNERGKLTAKLSPFGFNWNISKKHWFVRKERIRDIRDLYKVLRYNPEDAIEVPSDLTQMEAETALLALASQTTRVENPDVVGLEGYFSYMGQWYGRWASVVGQEVWVMRQDDPSFRLYGYKLALSSNVTKLLRKAILSGHKP